MKAESSPMLDRAVITAVFAAITVLVVFPAQDPDTFWHLANGRAMVEEGRIINEEIFSYTKAGTKFSNHEWLAQIILFLAYDRFGAAGLLALKLIIVWTTAFLLFRTARLLGANSIPSAIFSFMAIYAGISRYVERPELFSILFVSLTGFLLYGYRAGRLRWRMLLFLPVILLLWDFLHGAVYGVTFLMAYMAGETLKKTPLAKLFLNPAPAPDERQYFRRLWMVFLITLAVMAVNPYGPMSYGLFVESLHDKSLMASANMEYEPASIREFPLFWGLLVLTIAAVILSALTRKLDLTYLCVLTPFAAAAIMYNRATAFFAIASVPVIADFWRARISPRGIGLKAVIVIFLMAPVLSMFINAKFIDPGHPLYFGWGIDEKRTPVAATRFIKETGINGNMFNPGNFGGYLAFNLFPERRIFQYNTSAVFGEFTQITQSRGFLDKYKIDYAVIREDPWTRLVFAGGRFAPVFWDVSATVLVRNSPENAAFIEKYGIRYFVPGIDEEGLRLLESYTIALPRLTREMAGCLAFSSNGYYADRLGGLLLNPENPISAEEAIMLAKRASKYNGKSAALKNAIVVLEKKRAD